jgi:hypothetical protein
MSTPDDVGPWTSADEEALHAQARQLLETASQEMLAIEPSPSVWVTRNSALRAIIHLIEPQRRATPSTPGVREALLDWLAENPTLELTHYSPVYADDDDDAVEWRVHQQGGNINDREWTLIGKGQTPSEALTAARAALSAKEQGR